MKSVAAAAEKPNRILKAAKPMLAGILFGLVGSLIILAVFSVLMTVHDFPDGAISTLAVAAVAIGCFFGGFISARLNRNAGLITGLITGLAMFVLLMLAGLAVKGASFGVSVLIKLIVAVISGGIGGILGVNSRKKQRI